MYNAEQLPSLLAEFHKLNDPNNFWNDWNLPAFRNEATGVSMYENDDQIILEAAVPGAKAEQIDISLEKGVLWIQSKAVSEPPKGSKTHAIMDRKYSYKILLPVKIDEHRTPQAECRDGIVTVKLQKSQSSKPMKIPVQCA